MLFENYRTPLLVFHALGGFACVGLATHLVLWLRPWLRGQAGNHRGVRRFALLSALAYAFTMLLGLALYPTYRIRVRAEYLENPSAIARATEAQAQSASQTLARDRESRQFRAGKKVSPVLQLEMSAAEHNEIALRSAARIKRGAVLVRWFDVKEHWSALGLMIAGALALMLSVAPPRPPDRRMARGALILAGAAALIAWSSAIIGLVIVGS